MLVVADNDITGLQFLDKIRIGPVLYHFYAVADQTHIICSPSNEYTEQIIFECHSFTEQSACEY